MTLGFTYDDAFLRDLPTSDNLYSVLETMQPSLIPDRFTEGGLSNGQPARVGGFLSSWTQTRFRIGDVDLTDPTGSGEPLLFPSLGPWQRIQVATGLLPGDVNATGLAITLEPRAATATWQHTAEGTFSHGGLTGDAAATGPPTIARLGGWDRVALSSTGPLIADRLGAARSRCRGRRSAQFDRNQSDSADATLGSAFASLAYTAPDGSALNTIGWFQHASVPFEYRLPYGTPAASTAVNAGHLQTTWRVERPTGVAMACLRQLQPARRARRRSAPRALVERLLDGPVSAVASPSRGTVRQWSVGARVSGTRELAGRGPPPRRRPRSHRRPGHALPRRRYSRRPKPWTALRPAYGSSTTRARRRSGTICRSARTSTTSCNSRRDCSSPAGVRFESVSGSADGAAQGISWQSVLPRARLHWRTRETGSTTMFVGYTRSAYRLPLDLLAFGDPAAPTADLFRWDGDLARAGGPLVARVGPGTGGNADFSRIDPGLKRPIADELAFGFELAPEPTDALSAGGGRPKGKPIRQPGEPRRARLGLHDVVGRRPRRPIPAVPTMTR